MQLAPSLKKRRGFTLIEIIIAMTLFAMIAAMGTTFFVQISRIYKRVTLQNQLLNESEFVMERLRQTIGENTLDYEEYYSHTVDGETNYGQNYGDYGAQFYSGGRSTGENTGSDAIDTNEQTELYLINGTGDHKIIIGREATGTDTDLSAIYAISIAEMEGTDSDVDGIPETWTCASDFTCPDLGTTPNPDDWTDGSGVDDNFIPITPSTITITSLKFYVSPLEDPRKAYAEKTSNVIIQPHVTIVMTAQITKAAALGTYGNTPSIQLETTVSSRVYNDVTSYTNS